MKVGLLAGVVLVTTVLAACTSTPATVPTADLVISTTTIPASTSRGSTAPPTTAPPPPTAPTAATTDFRDPVAVARDWMTQWCSSDYREPHNHNIERATVFATPAAKSTDLAYGTTTEAYRTVVTQRLSSRCDQITAAINPDAEQDRQLVVVLVAHRTDLVADVPVSSDTVTVARSMLLQPDGRWLVDVPAPLPR